MLVTLCGFELAFPYLFAKNPMKIICFYNFKPKLDFCLYFVYTLSIFPEFCWLTYTLTLQLLHAKTQHWYFSRIKKKRGPMGLQHSVQKIWEGPPSINILWFKIEIQEKTHIKQNISAGQCNVGLLVCTILAKLSFYYCLLVWIDFKTMGKKHKMITVSNQRFL